MEMKDRLVKLGGDVKQTAEKLAKGAMDGSKKVAEKVKLRSSISQAESRLNASYMELGKKFEELYSAMCEGGLTDQLQEIADIKAQIADAKSELAALDSAYLCPNCGKYVQEGQNFCPSCGAKQNAPAEDAVPETEEPAEDAPAEEVPTEE